MANTRLNIIINGEDRASGPVRGVSGAIQGLGGIAASVGRAAAIGLGAVTAAAGAAVVGLGHLAAEAAPVANLQAAFEGFTTRMGEGADDMLAAMQAATNGMIPLRDLMASFNKAAQLVGDDFARQLPDAMGYLGSVAAATGADVGYLMDSLVTGVGRLSPMILDNLGITVNLEEAYQAFADANGLVASEMDKSQQQAALMAAVLEKLQANVGDLPDTSDSAAAQMARLKAQFQDVKDEIGIALLPILSEFVGMVSTLANQYLPPLINFLTANAVPAFEAVKGVIQNLLTAGQGLLDGPLGDAIQNLVAAFQEQLPAAQATVQAFLDWLRGAFGEIGPQLLENLTNAINALAELWRAHGDEIMTIVRFAFEGIVTVIGGTLTLASGLITSFLQLLNGDTQGALATLQGTWEAFMNMVLSIVGTNLTQFTAVWRGNFDLVKIIVQTSLERVGQIIQSIIDKIHQLGTALSNVHLPSWMQPGSPSPWEQSLSRTNALLSEMATKAVPQLGGSFGGLAGGVTPATAGAGAGGGAPIYLTMNATGVITEAMWDEAFNNLERVAGRRGLSISQEAS